MMTLKDIITDCEDRLAKAEKLGSTQMLEPLLHLEFQGITIRGYRVDKLGFIDSVCNPYVRFISLTIEDVEVSACGNSAIATGRSKFEVEIDDRIHSGTAQYLNLWHQENGVWKLRASSVTPESR